MQVASLFVFFLRSFLCFVCILYRYLCPHQRPSSPLHDWEIRKRAEAAAILSALLTVARRRRRGEKNTVFGQMCAFRWDRRRTWGAHGCREACFLRHGCDTGGGGRKGGRVYGDRTERQRQLHASVAQKRSSVSSQRVRGRPARRDHLSNSISPPPIFSRPTLATSVAFHRRVLNEILFWINAFLRALSPIRPWLKPQPTTPRPGSAALSQSLPSACSLFWGLFSPLIFSPEPCFLSRFSSFTDTVTCKSIGVCMCARARVCARKKRGSCLRDCVLCECGGG